MQRDINEYFSRIVGYNSVLTHNNRHSFFTTSLSNFFPNIKGKKYNSKTKKEEEIREMLRQ